MSSRIRLLVPVSVVLSLAFLAGCGGSGNNFTPPVPPPGGSFSASNLNGTYVFSVSGTDVNGAPIAIVGTFTANGQKGITAGTLDLNDPEFTPTTTLPNTAVTSSGSSYTIGVDGRGQITLAASTPFGSNLVFDFVLQDSSHGLITEFDNNATGSGTLDLQSSGVSPVGTYAFIFSGAAVNLSASTEAPWAMVGNFTVGSGGAITGLEDSNIDGLASPDLTLGGNLVLGPSSTPATTLTPSAGTGQTYDVFAINANHLKFIEMDTSGTLVGDAYAQSNATITGTTYAFVLEGAYPTSDAASAAGGFILTDGNGNITNTSTMDANNGGNGVVATTTFTGNYGAAGSGRYTLTNLSGFEGTQYAAYPFSGGLLLLEIDDAGIMSGAAYPQTQNAFSPAQGYAFNLTGTNLAAQSSTGSIEEVDDIAEFVANSTGTTITGLLDENYAPGGSPNYGLPFSDGTYTAPDANGRGQISANVGNNNNSTLNGGFALNFYSVDGTTFPFIEADGNGQVAAGVFVEQNASAATPAKAPSHLFVVRPMVKPRAFKRKLQ